MPFLLSLGLLLFTSTAFAHTGIGSTSGFMPGIMHPFGGIDHVLAMVAVGVFAMHLGGRAVWLVPTAFVLMMIVGGALGAGSIALPFVELGIALSVVALGLAVAFRMQVPVMLAAAMVGFLLFFTVTPTAPRCRRRSPG